VSIDSSFRILPRVSDLNRHFWQGGERGELVFLRCQKCGTFVHPPQPICPVDYGKDLRPEAVSGRGTVATFTVNHQAWLAEMALPYVIALITIDEQVDLRLQTNIVECDPDDVHIGLPVEVVFDHREDPEGDVWIPLFRPRTPAGPAANGGLDGHQ
jgi:uncharacterized OB-fold protein